MEVLMNTGYCTHGVECFHCEIERELRELEQTFQQDSFDLEYIELAQRAIANVTNLTFKVRTRDFLKKLINTKERT